jgi:hypothetical protein
MSEEIQEEPQQEYASIAEDGTIKINLAADAIPKQSADEVPVRDEPELSEEVREENVEEPVAEPAGEEEPVQNEQPVQEVEQPVLREITDEEAEVAAHQLDEQIVEAVNEAQESGIELPENIQKVVDFMNETNGTLEDYVRLNTDYSSLNEDQLLREYYQTTNPHLDSEDVDFMLEDKFSYDEDLDDEREVRRKKVERKQALANAKNHLDSLKSKYYEEIKMGSKLNPEQQKAVEFFNRYTKENEEVAKVTEKRANRFKQESEKVFSEGFEGFDYSVGDKKYRFKVKNPSEVKDTQGDINNFIKKFLNENGEISDAKGYHKSLFTAMNADQVAQHFYEQGKADAIKASVAKTKNVDMDPRGVHEKSTTSNGWTVRSITEGESSSKLKVRFRK